MRYVVEKDNIAENIDIMRQHCTGARIIAVVKGNGYGLGLTEYSKFLVSCGIDFLAVSRLEDAERLRNEGVACDIMLLSPPYDTVSARKCCYMGIIATVDSYQTALLLDKAANDTETQARAHLIVDTGFARFGFLESEKSQMVDCVRDCTSTRYEGVYTHLYNSYSRKTKSVTLQVSLFEEAVAALNEAGFTGLMRHICSSAAAVRFPQYHFDAVRLGSALIGRVAVKNTVGLKKVGFTECEVISKKLLPENHFVLYGEAFKTKKPTVTAVVPIGTIDGFGVTKAEICFSFWDRLSCALKKLLRVGKSQNLTCTVNGKKVKVIGKVGFTDIILDVTKVDCAVGDLAVIQMNPLMVDSSVKRDFV